MNGMAGREVMKERKKERKGGGSRRNSHRAWMVYP